MSFLEIVHQYDDFDFEAAFSKVCSQDVERVLQKHTLNEADLLVLLSPAAEDYLEQMAQIAHASALRHFGRSVLLFSPLYIANYCNNHCTYCTFSGLNSIKRQKLNMEEIEAESKAMHDMGYRHTIVLTGEDRQKTPVSYIEDAVKVMKQYFDSISLEVYPLEEEEYRTLYLAGADSFCMYQETYNEACYKAVHPKGPKHNYKYRLEAPERAARAGMRSINISALLGLYKWRSEAFFTALHGDYLQRHFNDVDILFSIPRMRPYIGAKQKIYEVSDKNLVQAILAYRLFMPYAGISVSTRESAAFRKNILPFGVTKLSADSKTTVGGHRKGIEEEAPQFEIADDRSMAAVKKDIIEAGYQPILKDWMVY